MIGYELHLRVLGLIARRSTLVRWVVGWSFILFYPEFNHLEEAVLRLDYICFTLGPLGIFGQVRRVSDERD